MSHFLKTHFTKPAFGLLCCLAGLSVFNITLAHAKEASCDLCLPQWIASPKPVPPLTNKVNQAQAQQLTQPNAQNYHLKGQVELAHPGSLLLSNEAIINRQKQTAQAWGQVRLYRKSIMITADKLILNQAKQTAQAKKIEYQFTQNRSHGTAKIAHLNQMTQIADLKSATYTTCPMTHYDWLSHFKSNQTPPTKHYAWELNFSTLEINNQKRRIYGTNTWLTFQQVPIFYTPYLSIPMDKRASGLLFPTFGSHKSINRADKQNYFAQPYYFNLAPNVDDTLTAILLQDSGLVLDNEFRYQASNHQAVIKFSGLNDQKAKQQGLPTQRGSAQIDATQSWDQWLKGLSSNEHWVKASDRQYFNDIPVNPSLENITQTNRQVNLNYQQPHLTAHLNMTDSLRLGNSTTYNYEKRPEFSISYQNNLKQDLEHIHYQVGGIMTEFELANNPNNARPEGQRSVFNPSIKYSQNKPYGFIESQLVLNHIQYNLQHLNLGSVSPNITVPQWGLKSGLNFERNGTWGHTGYIQTLEPVIQYLYVPYQNQSNTPLFDTSTHSLDFSNLFSYNRFSGYDRIGDTQQVSAALTTRFLTEEGKPLGEAGIGQIFYLADQKVQLSSGTPASTQRQSDYFVKLGATIGPFYFSSTSQFSNQNFELTNANSRAKLSLSPNFKLLMTDKVANLNRPGEQEEAAAGFYWRINGQWSIGSYANYNFTQNLRTEMTSAIRYESCCWASELSVKEAQLSNGLYNYTIAYNFELKGLSSVGTRFKDYLSNQLNF